MRGGARHHRGERERGSAAVEFALVAPLLLLLLFAIISYGYMLSYRQALSQGAAEGARAAAVALPSSTSGAKITLAVTGVNEALNSYGVSCTAAPATSASTSATGDLVKSSTTVGSCLVTIATCVQATASECATVTINHAYEDHPLLPTVPGMGIVLPGSLSYTAVAEVS
jgi:Flp pilus assembly protein TadG